MKPFREPALVKPVIKTALKVAEEHTDSRIDILTRLRAAICLATEAGLDIDELLKAEQEVGE